MHMGNLKNISISTLGNLRTLSFLVLMFGNGLFTPGSGLHICAIRPYFFGGILLSLIVQICFARYDSCQFLCNPK